MSNRLLGSKSPYLKQAANQPVDWYPWSEEAFEAAKRKRAPIFLSIGAIWCHWCHVMAKECFENEELAKIINDNFIPIKVDRDERPDIDRRYQEAVLAMTGTGGWPLTVFLTPQGKAFFGGTYFPSESKFGIPSLRSILEGVLKIWHERQEEVEELADLVFRRFIIYHSQTFSEDINWDLLNQGMETLLKSIDYVNGGIGPPPKFHNARGIELLIYHYFFKKSEVAKKAATLWLDKMAQGGIYDHLLGGFFRYSTDEKWMIPHFEKILSDNAELLRVYTVAHRVFGMDLYKRIAEGIVNYYKKYGHLEDGGFYESQDADVEGLEEGAYYIFTFDEIKSVLAEDEVELANSYFNFQTETKKTSNPDRYVLALRPGSGLDDSIEAIKKIKEKLLLFREKRYTQPYLDMTIYTSSNALMVASLCEYWKAFHDQWAKEQAEKTIIKLLREYVNEHGVFHTFGVNGFSDDYIFLCMALICIFEVTQKNDYVELAVKIADKALELFWDDENFGFFDRDLKEPNGYLAMGIKNIQDSPIVSANGIAPYVFLLLGQIKNRPDFIDCAEKTLKAFAGLTKRTPMVSFSYFISLYAYLEGICKVETEKFFKDVLFAYRPFKITLNIPREDLLVCQGTSCQVFNDLSFINSRSFSAKNE
ncbi:MAG: thioredoxin domain-containing protein [Deltaproteobacteria bacterium]|nr:thioredoxin domain-containing protein [Deltaproteobacteria bacterium]